MRTRLAAAAGLWALCVGAVALLAWLAIDTAGRQVPAQALSGAGTGVPADHAVPQVAAPGPADRSGRPGVPRSGPDEAAVFHVDAGSVSSRCAGSDISLDGGFARPDPGWAVEVLDAGPARVQVVFSDSRRAVEVLGRCTAGKAEYVRRTVDLTAAPAADTPAPPAFDGRDAWGGSSGRGGSGGHDGQDAGHHGGRRPVPGGDHPTRSPAPSPRPSPPSSSPTTASPPPTPTESRAPENPQKFSGAPSSPSAAPTSATGTQTAQG